MKPVDPRLLRHARAARWFLAGAVLLGVAGAGLVIAQAMLIAEIIVGGFQRGEGVGALRGALALLALVSLGRAAVSWLTELCAHRSSASVKSELRERLLARATDLGPSWLDAQRSGELTTLATRGVDALDDYFARYVPQLGLAVVVPVAVLGRIVTEDWISALTIAVTLPLIPVFMTLIGWYTQARMDRQWKLLGRLSGHFLDVTAGLPTLKVFGRAKAQVEAIRRITGEYRQATMQTLRIAFLSSFVLELLSTISVALVAVGIGMRLVSGGLDLYTGLVVLVLAPEAYLPLRQVGVHYHAAAEGLTAAEQVFAVLETPVPASGAAPVPDAADAVIELADVTVCHSGRAEPAVADVSFTVRPGETVALVGPSGGGKTTLLNVLLGFTRPAAGRVTVGGTDLADIDLAGWRERIAWVPQRPYLFAGTVADNVRLARPEASAQAVRQALCDAGAPDLDADQVLGEAGAGLSAGQRQRVALARAFLADRPLLLLDEPTAALDGVTEAAVVDATRRLAAGRTVLLVVHRPALLALADRVVTVDGGSAQEVAPADRWADPPFVRPAANGAPNGHHFAMGSVPPVAQVQVQRGVMRGIATAPRGSDDGPLPEGTGSAGGPAEGYGTGQVSGGDANAGSNAGPVAGGGSDPVAGGGWGGVPGGGSDGFSGAGWGAGTGSAAGGKPSAARQLRRVRRIAGASRARLTWAVALGALALLSAVGLMGTSGWLISRASQHPPVLYLMVAVTATRTFGIGRAVFRYAERLVSHEAVFRALADLRAAVYSRLERLAPAGLKGTRRGDLLSRLVSDVDGMQDYFLRWLLPAATAVTAGLASAAATGWLLPRAGAALAVGLLAAGAGVPALSGAVSRRAERRLAPARGELSARVLDLFTGTAELTVAGALPARRTAASQADRVLTRLTARSAASAALGAGLSALITGLTVVACATAGLRAVADGRLPGVELAVVLLVPLAAFEAVSGMTLAVQHRQRARRAAQRVYEVLDSPEPVREPELPAAVPEAGPFPLRLRGLTARYPGQDRLALDGVDLDLTAGRRIAVVGPSGAGKTTLAHVLLRFLDAEDGAYTLAGTDAAALAGDAVRRLVGLCAQDAHIFDSTIRENLRLARPDADDDELLAAMAAARLDGDLNLDTAVGEHGARLSGGQRQRLALARALLADFPVLVLDEPAEHLDMATADALTADLLAAVEGRATVLITHRLTGLEDVDEIVVLQDGRVAQRGRYGELAAADGPFRRLVSTEEPPAAVL